jgi:4-alpha-glucanotransferase
MSETSALDRLSERVGIEPDYWDIWGNHHPIPDHAKRRILDALGYPADDDAAVEASLARVERETWCRRLPPTITSRGEAALVLPVFLPEERVGHALAATIVEEDGAEHEVSLPTEGLRALERRTVDGRAYARFGIALPLRLPWGYHTLRLNDDAREISRLIVAPGACYLPPGLRESSKQWGLSAQLYTLRGPRDLGIGDFGNLGRLVDVSARLGAGLIGLNPLHALFSQQPNRASPYSPSSRVFVNALYIHIEAVPCFAECADAHRLLQAGGPYLDELRAAETIDYDAITRFKIEVLDAIWSHFRAHERAGAGSPGSRRGEAFARFCDKEGERLVRFAIFEALCEWFGARPWQEWPEAYRDPASEAVRIFAEARADRIDFYRFLQWLADEQLAAVKARADAQGLSIGLYRDLAIGCALDGADAWAEQDVIVQRAKVGCPPDPFNMLGQDWGVPPLHPHVLRERGLEPFAAIIRANMRHAGALRIDHAMGLMHLFWIPGDGTPRDGAYVTYGFEDMLAVLALESHRHRCLVVGEDLGTVPAGFRERMADDNILSYRVLYFEKDGERFKRPDEYPGLALACITTHDLATLSGFWRSADIDLKHRLELYPSQEAESDERAGRNADRLQLLRTLLSSDMLPEGMDAENPDVHMAPVLSAALHRYLARSDAGIMLVQVDDLTEELEQVNVPGTVDERPNWRRRLSMDVDEIASAPVTRALIPHLATRSDRPEGHDTTPEATAAPQRPQNLSNNPPLTSSKNAGQPSPKASPGGAGAAEAEATGRRG